MKGIKIVALLVAMLALACAASGVAPAATPNEAAVKAVHPEVDVSISCVDCHADATPDVVQAWSASAHGTNTVLCLVCHGSTGEDFITRPAVERCVGCHGDAVATMGEPFMKGKTCFTCHAPHALDPHAASGGGEQ